MKIPPRLEAVAMLIEKYGNHGVLADIGSDHAYLPCFLASKNVIHKGYASEVAKGPYQKSVENIALYQLEDKVEPLLGDGLETIVSKDIDMISICGMGGILITQILDKHLEKFDAPILFLQANTAIDELRHYLFEHHYHIKDEVMVKDAHHLYEIMVCVKKETKFIYTKEDLLFGPVLRHTKGELFHKKWNRELTIKQNILSSLDLNHPKYQEVSLDIARIEALLHES